MYDLLLWRHLDLVTNVTEESNQCKLAGDVVDWRNRRIVADMEADKCDEMWHLIS